MSFKKFYEQEPLVETHAHGRVNLIGEHTDYNHGFVLPTNIQQATHVALRPRTDQTVRMASANQRRDHHIFSETYVLGEERRRKNWSDYLQGVTSVLRKDGLALRGFEVFIQSDIPMGSGLSSSAALDVSILRGLNEMFQLSLSGLDIAKIAQRVEVEFVGANVGIMDPMVISLGKWGEALFIDTQSLESRNVPLPLDKVDLLIINSGVKHSNVHGGGYNERRRECEEASQALGVKCLRDVTAADLARINSLPPVLARRARHVVTENDRVLRAVKALERHDFRELGELFCQSHVSMKNDYQVSIPEIDLLVDLACEHPSVYGARLTGGGFGGSIVCLTNRGEADRVGADIKAKYEAKTHHPALILKVSEAQSPQSLGEVKRGLLAQSGPVGPVSESSRTSNA